MLRRRTATPSVTSPPIVLSVTLPFDPFPVPAPVPGKSAGGEVGLAFGVCVGQTVGMAWCVRLGVSAQFADPQEPM